MAAGRVLIVGGGGAGDAAAFALRKKGFDGEVLMVSADHDRLVALPAGSYTVSARAEKQGYVRVPVLIKTGQRTILDLDLRDKESPRRLAHN